MRELREGGSGSVRDRSGFGSLLIRFWFVFGSIRSVDLQGRFGSSRFWFAFGSTFLYRGIRRIFAERPRRLNHRFRRGHGFLDRMNTIYRISKTHRSDRFFKCQRSFAFAQSSGATRRVQSTSVFAQSAGKFIALWTRGELSHRPGRGWQLRKWLSSLCDGW